MGVGSSDSGAVLSRVTGGYKCQGTVQALLLMKRLGVPVIFG